MVTTFNAKDMTEFGKYLLSEKRTELIAFNHSDEDSVSLKERLQEVYHADFENWKTMKENKGSIPLLAKFEVVSIDENTDPDNKIVALMAVTEGSEENKSFSKYTPSGIVNIAISKESQAAGFFAEGEECFVKFIKPKK